MWRFGRRTFQGKQQAPVLGDEATTLDWLESTWLKHSEKGNQVGYEVEEERGCS